MSENVTYLYHVKHPEHGEVNVVAKDRLTAAAAAAKAWGVRWTSIARECSYERRGEASETKKQPAKKRPAGAKKKEGVTRD